MSKKLQVLKVKDSYDKSKVDKGLLFNTPARCLLIGPSERSGKTTLLVNLLCRPEFYLNDFSGTNMYIVSESVHIDDKMKHIIRCKDIPQENLYSSFDEEQLSALFDTLEKQFSENKRDKKPNPNLCLVLDDVAHTGALKANAYGVLSKLLFRGRHILASTFMLVQKYSYVSTALRQNYNGVIVFNINSRELELIEEDHNYLASKKEFFKMFREAVKEGNDFLCINYTNPHSTMYLDKNFEPIPF